MKKKVGMACGLKKGNWYICIWIVAIFFFGNLGSYSKFLIGGNLGSLGGNFFLISSN